MAPFRSLGNTKSIFDDFYARTGKDAIGDPGAGESTIIPYGLDQSSSGNADYMSRSSLAIGKTADRYLINI